MVDSMSQDLTENAGRCDWCGAPIKMAEGEQLEMSVFDGVSEDVDGEALDHPLDAAEVTEAIADAVENLGGPKDAMLADILREQQSYKLHRRCFEKSALADVYTER